MKDEKKFKCLWRLLGELSWPHFSQEWMLPVASSWEDNWDQRCGPSSCRPPCRRLSHSARMRWGPGGSEIDWVDRFFSPSSTPSTAEDFCEGVTEETPVTLRFSSKGLGREASSCLLSLNFQTTGLPGSLPLLHDADTVTGWGQTGAGTIRVRARTLSTAYNFQRFDGLWFLTSNSSNWTVRCFPDFSHEHAQPHCAVCYFHGPLLFTYI